MGHGVRQNPLDEIFFIFPAPPLLSQQRDALVSSSGCPLSREIRSAQKGAGAVSGINSALNPVGLFLVATFRPALLRQAAIAVFLVALLRLARRTPRNWLPAAPPAPSGAGPQGGPR
jgi:hypothetical protein